MSYANFNEPAIWSHSFAAVAFAALALRLSLRWKGGLRASVLLCAALASALWAAVTVAGLAHPGAELWGLSRVLDSVRMGAWIAFVAVLLDAGRAEGATLARMVVRRRWQAGGLAVLLTACALLPQAPPWLGQDGAEQQANLSYSALLATSVVGLALTEQLYRRSPDRARWAIKPLVVGLGGMFALDLAMYADAVLYRQLDAELWAARGIAYPLVIVFLAMATARNAEWTIDLHFSRSVVSRSTAVLAASAYLMIVAAAAYWVRLAGGGWGGVLQVALVFAALLALATLMSSGRARSWLRVVVSKHFFAYRYDYRQEWLKFTNMLGTPSQDERLSDLVVRALAELVESLGGGIWLERGDTYRQVGRPGLGAAAETEPANGPLASFLLRTGWVIRIDEWRRKPGAYPGLMLPEWLARLPEAWLVVPLSSVSRLVGFVVLAHPRVPLEVNWEVLDLLKTAGRQAASYLAQMEANEALLEADKFDAFNRMSAFVVHDLKNLVAQLALLLKNAERHRDNPEFQRDMQETVEHVVNRMNQLLLQLHSGTRPGDKPRPVDLAGVIGRILRTKADSAARIDVEASPDLRALAHEDRIERVIGHLVQNALEALDDSNGRVRLRAYREGRHALVEVDDDGVGMSPDFVRDRLFRPFQTTKPLGMGIGMNESFQYINGIGGKITVESAPGSGSRFRLTLPLADVSVPDKPMTRAA